MNPEEFLFYESLAALIVWVGVLWRWRHDGGVAYAGRLLFVSAFIAVLGQLARSAATLVTMLPTEASEVGLLSLGIVRGWFLIVGIALILAGPKEPKK